MFSDSEAQDRMSSSPMASPHKLGARVNLKHGAPSTGYVIGRAEEEVGGILATFVHAVCSMG